MRQESTTRKSPLRRHAALVVLAGWLGTQGSAIAAEKLSAEEIRSQVVDHTLEGSVRMDRYAEYYAPSGEVHGFWSDGTEIKGRWRIEGDSMCFSYSSPYMGDGCYRVEVQGQIVRWYHEDGSPAITAYRTPGDTTALMK